MRIAYRPVTPKKPITFPGLILRSLTAGFVSGAVVSAFNYVMSLSAEFGAGILAGAVDEDVYIESLRGQLEAQGIVPGEEVEEKSIGSQTYHCLSAITESEGVVMNQYYLLRKIDSHMFCILITAQEDETADEYIAMFAEV